mmetsp:Transcript_32810/g.57192  ORF Transcript_32810/g.57192 Transcript_32810/m.57192 type:complete len:894 (-) Transcript_32810:1736-4417(-)
MNCCCIRIIGQQVKLPIKGVSMSIEIQQDIAAVSLAQTFLNESADPIEVEYVFPIPSEAALSSLRIHTDDKIIEAQVKDKEVGREAFSDALASGSQAYIGEVSDKNDIVTLQIGLLKPQSEVLVEVTYVVECKFDQNAWSLVVPIDTLPRHDDPFIHGTYNKRTQDWSFGCNLNASSPLTEVTLNIAHKTIRLADNSLRLEATTSELPATDIKLEYTAVDFSTPYTLVQKDLKTGDFGLHFSFQPKISTPDLEDFDPTGEFILLLDRSGSMSGGRIEMAKEAVNFFIKSLPEQSLFNIVSFGSYFSKMFPESQKYSKSIVDSALAQLRSYSADMQGTEIYEPLKDILNSEPTSSFPRYVFLVTDGDVSNTQLIVNLVKSNHKNTRVSTIGIGSGASNALVEEVAKAGRGSSTLILENRDINSGVLSSLEKSLQPSLNDVRIEWLSGSPISVSPSKPFFAFNGDRIAFNAILKSGPVAFRINYVDSLDSLAKSFSFENDLSAVSEGNLALVQAVRGAVGTEKEVELAERYNVLTKNTCLLAICSSNDAPLTEAPKQVKVSLSSQPISMHNQPIFGGPFPPMPMPYPLVGGPMLRSAPPMTYGMAMPSSYTNTSPAYASQYMSQPTYYPQSPSKASPIPPPPSMSFGPPPGHNLSYSPAYAMPQSGYPQPPPPMPSMGFAQFAPPPPVQFPQPPPLPSSARMPGAPAPASADLFNIPDDPFASSTLSSLSFKPSTQPKLESLFGAHSHSSAQPDLSYSLFDASIKTRNEVQAESFGDLFDAPARAPSSSKTPSLGAAGYTLQTLSALIVLQNPDGSWAVSSELQAQLLRFSISLELGLSQSTLSPDVYATSVVLALISERFQEHQDAWKLVVVKGRRWLKKQGASMAALADLIRE